jgi:RNAse (barnase) inhibitor barstar
MGKIVTFQNLHETFAERLYFPIFYGKNWNAFWNAITGLVEMPKVLTLTNWEKFERTFKNDSIILGKIIDDYNKLESNKKIEINAGDIE